MLAICLQKNDKFSSCIVLDSSDGYSTLSSSVVITMFEIWKGKPSLILLLFLNLCDFSAKDSFSL